jgi:trans-2,3-dihydro-3-hydroxyanthranilate isomerase
VRDLKAIGRIVLDMSAWPQSFGVAGRDSAYAYTRQTAGEAAHYHARMFSPGDGIPEDPATGAAVAALAGVIARFEDLAPGEHVFRIEQGVEIGRPSLIELGMTIEGVSLASATIGGSAVPVSEGTLRV